MQGCGVVAAVLLTVMLLPQLWHLFRSRRAEELSHVFMGLMIFGLSMLTVYNVILELWVFMVAALLQLVLCAITQGGKVWADRYQRRLRSQPGGQLARALSLRSGAKIELAKFAAGSEAPFPLLRPAPTHTAQHLLLDARLPAVTNNLPAGTVAGADVAPAPFGFADVAELLRGALADAGQLLRRGQLGPVSGLVSGPAASRRDEEAQEEEAEEAETAFFECHDGYAALVFHADLRSLSVDCLAVTEQSMRGMVAAAQAFTSALEQRCPGSKVAASSMGRLPAAAA